MGQSAFLHYLYSVISTGLESGGFEILLSSNQYLFSVAGIATYHTCSRRCISHLVIAGRQMLSSPFD